MSAWSWGMATRKRHEARRSPAVGLPRASWAHFASAPFSAPVAAFRGGDFCPAAHARNHARRQHPPPAQGQRPGGVSSAGYVGVVGHRN